ncbi:MAG: UDP-N-acetylmuramate:L-alanyl-gamma-D-glutamyl-meso-diaminopimelate ligase [Verrucomicrobiales bacterium]
MAPGNNPDSPSPKRFHFVGICGTAMGSVAAALKEAGHEVTGSDDGVYPPMSDFLASRGISIQAPFAAANLPPENGAVIVIGNAMSRGNPEVEAVLNARLPYISLPEALKENFLRGRHNVVVAGTHGKTTTTSMCAWVLRAAGLDPDFMIGGIPKNLGQGARLAGSDYFVIEGDEYDTAFFDKRSKFVHYLPEVAIINNVEFDHADIYDDLEAVMRSFERLLYIVPGNGLLLLNGDDANCRAILDRVRLRFQPPAALVGFGERCDRRIENVEYLPGESRFTLEGETYAVPMVGEFNVRNAAMAACAARFYGVDPGAIRAALAGFEGIKRRQDLRGEKRGVKVIDDFGHHPTAIRETVPAIRQQFPGCRVWAIFEPRSNTSRRNLMQAELAQALASADVAIVAAVANPEKVPGGQLLDVAAVTGAVAAAGKEAFQEDGVEAIVARVAAGAREGDVVVVFSNGGFGGIHDKLLAAL